METAQRASQLPPIVSEILGYVVLILIVVLIVNHKRKKKGKPSLFSLLKKKKSSGGSDNRTPWYGDYPKLISIEAFKKVSDKTYVVFDLETTGLFADNDQIIEIGAVRVVNGEITDQYHQLVNPGIRIPAEATEKNHITDDMVKNQPRLQAVLPDFLNFVGSDVLAAHNAGFDASFLDNACRKYNFPEPKKYFDTMRLSVYWKNLRNRKLETFLKAAGIQNDNAHRALSDAEATAKLIIASMNKIG